MSGDGGVQPVLLRLDKPRIMLDNDHQGIAKDGGDVLNTCTFCEKIRRERMPETMRVVGKNIRSFAHTCDASAPQVGGRIHLGRFSARRKNGLQEPAGI